MIYLCSPYTGDGTDESRERNYEAIGELTAFLLKNHDEPVFSPIIHCHNLQDNFELPDTWEFWEKIDFGYMEACSKVWVATMPGWSISRGVTAEIAYAMDVLDIPVEYIDMEKFDMVKENEIREF